MNIAEALAKIFKTKGQSLIRDFVKEDIPLIIKGVVSESAKVYSGRKINLKAEVVGGFSEVSHLVRVLPGRVKYAFDEFQKDIIQELEVRGDKKEKALFCLKLLTVLSGGTLRTAYGFHTTRKLSVKSVFLQYLLIEILFRSMQLFALRLVRELESEVDEKEGVQSLKYINTVLNTQKVEGIVVPATDPAFLIVEKLKKIILYGDDELRKTS